MCAIDDEDRVIVPAKYVKAVKWLKDNITIYSNDFPMVMYTLGCFVNEVTNLDSQIEKYKEDKNEN